MAIKNGNNNYLKITNIDDSDLTRTSQIITWELWESEAIKDAPTQFDKAVKGHTMLGDLTTELDKTASNSKTIKNNRITAAYLALKQNDTYSDWTDC